MHPDAWNKMAELAQERGTTCWEYYFKRPIATVGPSDDISTLLTPPGPMYSSRMTQKLTMHEVS
jgi:hypothetical protein